MLFLLLAGLLPAQPVAPPVPVASVTSIQQFWDLTPEQRAQTLSFEIDCLVTYFDPYWRILFVQDAAGTAAYVPYGQNDYPFKAGESITARGQFIPPNADLSFEHAVIVPRTAPVTIKVPDATVREGRQVSLHNKYVTLVGFVDRQRRQDGQHLQLVLSSEGETVNAWVLMREDDSTPDFTDQVVRVEGVFNDRAGLDGSLATLEIMVSSVQKVSRLGSLKDDPSFTLPVTAISSIQRIPPEQKVRVVGAVVAREPGRWVRIRDASGQLDVMTGQMRTVDVNEQIEAVGYPAAVGQSLRLDRALFQSLAPAGTGRAAPSGGRSGVIGLAADVLNLAPAEAQQEHPVHLVGVVTWSHQSAPFFFIHDSSGGVCVLRGTATSPVRSPGRNVEVEGRTAMGPFAPVVVARKFERISDAILPVARQVSIEHALTGGEEAQWVEMRGYLRRVYREGPWNMLEMATASSDFVAVLPFTEDVSAMVGSVIRLHGVCAAEADAKRKLTGIRLWVPGINYVQVEEPAPRDPFTVPLRPLASLGQYEAVQSFNRRLRVEGTVVHSSPGHSIRLEQDGQSLLVLTREKGLLLPGDRVEAVGFLGQTGGRLTLREAIYRITGSGRQPTPRPFDPQDRPNVSHDGQLITTEGTVIGSSSVGNLLQITVQSPHKVYDAVLDAAPRDTAVPADGTKLRLTGVYEVEYDEHGRPESFTLHLRSPADLAVLQAPSWWTRARILAFTGVLALGAALFLGWNTVLRRQVRRQTDQIRTQMERESRLQSELARAGKLESLGLLAGGIAHDFNNLLTVLMGNISLARLDPQLGADSSRSLSQAEKAAGRARDLTQQLLTFAKGGAPIRAAISLPEVVREVAEFALRGSRVRCEFRIPADLWPANVDKGQIGQVVQNIVINALQAMPEGGVVDITLENRRVGPEMAAVLAPGRYVHLEIADHGPGIAAADLGRIFDPYFTTKQNGSGLGLATVHSIVKKHNGHITAESAPGRGTAFQVWLPAAESATPTLPVPVAAPGRDGTAGHARVLVMDDEAFIRDLAASILRRYGYAVTAVEDGAAAVAAYRRARENGASYDLVILDLTIPGGMGGRQTMEELRRIDPEVRAIVSSGYSNDAVLANYQAHGFSGLVSKPYDVTDFLHAVERVLAGKPA